MSHTLNCQYIHLIWSTKNQYPYLNEDLRVPLLSYLGGIFNASGGYQVAGSATSNHVHLLIQAPTTISISELLRQAKRSSSHWHHQREPKLPEFSWSEGYLAFTVNPLSTEKIRDYFVNENHRHKAQSYEQEISHFLKYHEIVYHPDFLLKTTYTKLVYHLVWSVKNRCMHLEKSFEPILHKTIHDEMHGKKCVVYAIGYVTDHIHILMECPKNTSVADIVQHLKTTSTYAIRAQGRKHAEFSWQEGFGIFSVGKPQFDVISNYVNNQDAHHKTKTFNEEWESLKDAAPRRGAI